MKHYHKNPRQISEKQFNQLQGWLEEYGDLSGIVHNIRTDEIIGGNQRSEAMHFMNGNGTKPVIEKKYDKPTKQGTVATGYFEWKGERYSYRQVKWTDKKAEGANVIANKAGGTWDSDVFLNLWEADDLMDWGFDQKELEKIGFEFGGSEDAEPEIDRAAELLKKWGVVTGDLWQIGNHRLICGDCTDAATVARVMGGERAVLMLTDPPYGVDYGKLVRSRENQKQDGWDDIQNDALSDHDLYNLLLKSLGGEGSKIGFVFHPPGERRWLFWNAVKENGWKVSQEIVWVKNSMVFGRADYQWRHEPCLYLKRAGAGNQEDRTQTTVWEVNKSTDSEHPTQKPVKLFEIPIRNHTSAGEIVYEPFSGSGTTLVACENLGRRGRAVEISPAYCAVTLERMSVAFPHLQIRQVEIGATRKMK